MCAAGDSAKDERSARTRPSDARPRWAQQATSSTAGQRVEVNCRQSAIHSLFSAAPGRPRGYCGVLLHCRFHIHRAEVGKITSALTEGGVRAHPRMDFPSHVAMRHGIVVDNDPFTSSGRLAKVACAQCWPNTVTASLQVAQNALDPFLAQLPRRTMTVASQSRRICGKAWLTNRSTGKSRPRQRTERQQQKGDHHE